MLEPREPKYRWGQPVVAATDLVNDGSHPGAAADELLVATGTKGEIVQTGMHEESNTPVYVVEFAGGKIVGCLEHELAPV